MKRSDVIIMNNSIADKALKNKHLSTESFLEIHSIRIKCKKYLDEMGEKEKAIFKDYEVNEGDKVPTKKENTGMWDKIETVQKEDLDIKKLNFVPLEEFRKWIEECDTLTASFLAEFFLK